MRVYIFLVKQNTYASRRLATSLTMLAFFKVHPFHFGLHKVELQRSFTYNHKYSRLISLYVFENC